MSRPLLVIDVQNEHFSGDLPIIHPAGHLDRVLPVIPRLRRPGELWGF